MILLRHLRPGTRFVQPDLGLHGTLLSVNDCRAHVALDQPAKAVEITDRNGNTRQFVARRTNTTSWTPTTPVVVTGHVPVNRTEKPMAKKSTPTKAKAKSKPATKAKAPAKAKAKSTPTTPAPAAASESMSQLDAAYLVLQEASEPMNCKAIIEAMAVKGYWTSPGGKTPHATLSSALMREIKTKGDDARFAKVGRGLFSAAK